MVAVVELSEQELASGLLVVVVIGMMVWFMGPETDLPARLTSIVRSGIIGFAAFVAGLWIINR